MRHKGEITGSTAGRVVENLQSGLFSSAYIQPTQLLIEMRNKEFPWVVICDRSLKLKTLSS